MVSENATPEIAASDRRPPWTTLRSARGGVRGRSQATGQHRVDSRVSSSPTAGDVAAARRGGLIATSTSMFTSLRGERRVVQADRHLHHPTVLECPGVEAGELVLAHDRADPA